MVNAMALVIVAIYGAVIGSVITSLIWWLV